MRAIAILLGVLAVSAVGCSKTTRNLTGPPADSRGTPLGAAGTFEAENRLLWSAATNEVVGTASFGSATPGALIGMNALTGWTRVLDVDVALAPEAPAAGTPVYYQAIVSDPAGADSMMFRRVPLTGGAPGTLDAIPAIGFYVYALAGGGSWLAWSRTTAFSIAPDSLVIESTLSGTRAMLEPGLPVLMSPDGSRLLYRTSLAPPDLYLHDRSAGTTAPFDLGLPPGAAPAGLRWDAAGVHALYLQSSQQLWVRDVTIGSQRLLYTTADTLIAYTGTWSPDGRFVALWSGAVADAGQRQTLSLHVVDVATRTGSVVARGDILIPVGFPPPPGPGAIVFSPDSRLVAHQYGDELFTSPVPGAGAGAHASGFPPGPASQAGGEVFGANGATAGASLGRRLARARATRATSAR